MGESSSYSVSCRCWLLNLRDLDFGGVGSISGGVSVVHVFVFPSLISSDRARPDISFVSWPSTRPFQSDRVLLFVQSFP